MNGCINGDHVGRTILSCGLEVVLLSLVVGGVDGGRPNSCGLFGKTLGPRATSLAPWVDTP
jgi:hypothetical protein